MKNNLSKVRAMHNSIELKLNRYENTPTIETDRLILRAFTQADAAALLFILSDETVNTFLPWFPIKTLAGAKEYLQKNYLEPYKMPSAYRYAICLKTDGIPIGYVNAGGPPSLDFGYGLRKEFWHQGIVTEAARAVADRMKQAGYPYLTATHAIENPRSGRVMKNLGMKYCYSYVEQWQPKNKRVIFRMYQLNFHPGDNQVYWGYWDKYPEHFIEPDLS